MNCHQMQEPLSAYADGELEGLEEARVEAHLGLCPPCRRRLEMVWVLKSALRRSPGPVMPEDLKAVLLEGAARAPGAPGDLRSAAAAGRPRAALGLTWVFAAAAAILILRLDAARREEIPLEALVAAHQRGAAAAPLAPAEAFLPDAFEEPQG